MTSAISAVMFTAFSAMLKVFLVSAIAFVAADYPKANPILPKSSLQILARLSNAIFLPCAVVAALGSTLSAAIFSKLIVLVLFAFIINSISYLLVFTIGKGFYKGDKTMFTALCVAVGSPNAVSFPILVMQTMCEQPDINIDYDSNSSTCFDEASTMLFVYSIGWHIIYWTFGFPMLESMKASQLDQNDTITQSNNLEPETTGTIISTRYFYDLYNETTISFTLVKSYLHTDDGKRELGRWLWNVLCSPAMLSIYIGIFIGLIPFLKHIIFDESAPLHSIGSVLNTVGEPLVCVNTFVMAASLAHADWRKNGKGNQEIYDTNIHTTGKSAVHSPLHYLETDDPIEDAATEPATESTAETTDNHSELPSLRTVAMHTMFR